MHQKYFLVVSLLVGLFILVLIAHQKDTTLREANLSNMIFSSRQQENLVQAWRPQECTGTSQLREQRDSLSRLLNEQKKKLGQLECGMAKLQKRETVASSGGWCEKESDHKKSTAHMFDESLANALGRFLSGQRVGSFGDGPGLYRQHLLQQGLVASYDAYDGAPFCENVTEGAVSFMDLTLPQYGFPVYDWVVCLEVAEHVPARYERVLLDNIARHAHQGVILSWAHLGQDGFLHVNNKSPEDVKRLMDEAGFFSDDKNSLSLRKNSTFFWFRDNIMVFRRKSDAVLKKDDA